MTGLCTFPTLKPLTPPPSIKPVPAGNPQHRGSRVKAQRSQDGGAMTPAGAPLYRNVIISAVCPSRFCPGPHWFPTVESSTFQKISKDHGSFVNRVTKMEVLGGGGIKSSIQTRAVMYLLLFNNLFFDYMVGLQTVMPDLFLLGHCFISTSHT